MGEVVSNKSKKVRDAVSGKDKSIKVDLEDFKMIINQLLKRKR